MARPAFPSEDVINFRVSPVKNRPARRILFSSILASFVFSISQFGLVRKLCAQPQTIEEAVQRLARRAAALPHERRVTLVWTNHGAVSVQRAEELKELFVTQLEAAQIHVAQGEAAPALRVSLEQTPSRIVIAASVPGEGASNVVIEELARNLVGNDERRGSLLRLDKELIWQSDLKVLSGALRGGTAGEAQKKMLILTEEALQVYGEEQGGWKLANSRAIPGVRLGQRGARGQLLLTDENAQQVGILLPGKRCEAGWADDSPVVCAAAGPDWPSGKLLASPACGVQTWLLKSDTTDWTAEDRLLLRNSSAGRDPAPLAELSVPGPVQSIAAGPDSGSATVVVRNLSSGNYEVYRVALACGN